MHVAVMHVVPGALRQHVFFLCAVIPSHLRGWMCYKHMVQDMRHMWLWRCRAYVAVGLQGICGCGGAGHMWL